MDLSGFGGGWEHLRLLSDPERNRVLVAMLQARAPGATVLEVGCGTGVLSCLAARLGAKRVYAVEPTGLASVARDLARANGVADRVVVLEGRVEDLDPRPVDFGFSELLNAFPFQEGVLPAMEAAAAWGPVEPHRLRVYAAAVRDPSSADEKRDALRELKGLGLDLSPLAQVLDVGAYRSVGRGIPCGPPTLLYDLPVGSPERPTPRRATLAVDDPGPVGGAMVWFEASYGDDRMTNAPGRGGHWGQLVCGWPELVGVKDRVDVTVTLDNGVSIRPA